MNNYRVDADFIPFILITNYRAIKFYEKYYDKQYRDAIASDRRRIKATSNLGKNK